MPTLKQDRTLMKRHLRDMLCLGVPFLLTILSTLLLCYLFRDIALPLFFAGWIVAVPIAVVGVVRQVRRFLRFPCPTCGTVLHRPGKAEDEGTPITFLCTACDTEWDTGFRVSRGD